MGRFFKWIAIIILAVSFIGTVFGMDDDTVVFLGEITICGLILFIAILGIVASKHEDSNSEEESMTKPKEPASNKTKTRFWDDIELTPKDIEDLYINDLFWEAEKKRQQEKNSKE